MVHRNTLSIALHSDNSPHRLVTESYEPVAHSHTSLADLPLKTEALPLADLEKL